jgi:hypothetical protein
MAKRSVLVCVKKDIDFAKEIKNDKPSEVPWYMQTGLKP